MAKKDKKLNSMRLLERFSVPYEVCEFSDAVHNAEEVAAVLGVPAEIVYKTLVVTRGTGKPLLVMIPA
ncbi:MAG: aminoacyl-tRNA deacylase, partial [Anaerolineae bacterium]|nr:aminoacyl-tRNA deacylase [Anaerolineae bacterium]